MNFNNIPLLLKMGLSAGATPSTLCKHIWERLFFSGIKQKYHFHLNNWVVSHAIFKSPHWCNSATHKHGKAISLIRFFIHLAILQHFPGLRWKDAGPCNCLEAYDTDVSTCWQWSRRARQGVVDLLAFALLAQMSLHFSPKTLHSVLKMDPSSRRKRSPVVSLSSA